jgi:hypothetical protein
LRRKISICKEGLQKGLAAAIAAFRAGNFEQIAEPNALALAAPMTRRLALGRTETHGKCSSPKAPERLSAACRPDARLREADDIALT